MKITEEPNKNKIVLQPPQFKCDKPLVKRDIEPFENKSFFSVYVGCAGSSKTSTMISSLTNKKIYRKAFGNIYIVMPRTSRSSLKKDPFQFLKRNHLYDDLTLDNLLEIHEELSEQSEDDDGELPNSLLVIDDMTQYLKDYHIQKTLNNLVLNRRHLRLSILMIVQYWNSIPLSLRKNVSSVVLCNKPSNKAEFDSITDEILHGDKNKAKAVVEYAFKKKYDKLFITCEPLTFSRNMNKLIISE